MLADARAQRGLMLVSLTEAAAANGISVSLLRLRCAEGRVVDAQRIGNRWAVPAGKLTILPPARPPGRPWPHKEQA